MSEKLDELETIVSDLVRETTMLVSSHAKMDMVLTSLSDSMAIMARKEVTVENHSVMIKELKLKTEKHDDNINKLEKALYHTCDQKSTEITKATQRIADRTPNREPERVSRARWPRNRVLHPNQGW